MIRVLVADDSPTVRALLVAILEADPELEVVGQATDGHEAVRLTRTLRPDLVTMDIHMPGLDGLDATKEIMAEVPTPIIIVSSAVTDEAVGASLDATRAGALLAMASPDPGSSRFEEQNAQLLNMIRAMADVKLVRRRRATAPRPPSPDRPAAAAAAAAAVDVEVVAVAASTGGPAALHRILMDLPRDFPVPILVVQHISSGFVDGLARWLNSHSTLRVRVAEQGQALEPRSVYLAPDDLHLGVRERGVGLLEGSGAVGGFRPAGSFLFESVARVYGTAAVGVILTGMGRDGATGALALHEAGGRVLAQDRATSVVYGMPAEAARIGAVDRVVPVHEMAAQIMELIEGVHGGY